MPKIVEIKVQGGVKVTAAVPARNARGTDGEKGYVPAHADMGSGSFEFQVGSSLVEHAELYGEDQVLSHAVAHEIVMAQSNMRIKRKGATPENGPAKDWDDVTSEMNAWKPGLVEPREAKAKEMSTGDYLKWFKSLSPEKREEELAKLKEGVS